MKLLKLSACLPAVSGGNVKRQTMMEDAVVDGLSDRGSTPLRSIKIVSQDEILWDYFFVPRVVEFVKIESSLGFRTDRAGRRDRTTSGGATTSSGRWFWQDRSETKTVGSGPTVAKRRPTPLRGRRIC